MWMARILLYRSEVLKFNLFTPKDQTVKDNVQKVPKNKTSTSAVKIKFIFLRKCYLFKFIYLNFQLFYFMNVWVFVL